MGNAPPSASRAQDEDGGHDVIYVDTRWVGHHGIARFARAVVPRISMPYVAITGRNPASPLDVTNLRRARLSRSATVYSPGYNSGLTRATQVLTVHDLIHLRDAEESSRLKRTYYESLVRPAIRRAGVVLTVSRSSQRDIQDWLGDDSVRVVNVGNGCDPVFDGPGPTPTAPADAPVFGFVGGLKPHKNIRLFLAAVRKYSECSAAIVSGSGSEIMSMAAQLGVADRTTVSANLSDAELAAHYRSWTALVVPSTSEGFGLPAVEAMRCGTRPIYWQGCESLAEIAGDYGLALESAADSDELVAAMRRAAELASVPVVPERQWMDRYSWDAVAAWVNSELESFVA